MGQNEGMNLRENDLDRIEPREESSDCHRPCGVSGGKRELVNGDSAEHVVMVVSWTAATGESLKNN